MTIHEGRKHQVKRMLEVVGHQVLKLVRIRMGTMSLGDLGPGEYRFLTDREANSLRELVKRRTGPEPDEGKRLGSGHARKRSQSAHRRRG